MTAQRPASRRPRGPEPVRSALFAATERLCSTLPPGSVTVRQIATEADVNHGLVHHYFESKDALLAATMLRVEEQFLTLIEGVEDAEEAVVLFFDGLIDRPTYPRLLAWMLLEGIDPTELIEGYPAVDQLVSLIGLATKPSEARLRTQALLAFVAGWATTDRFMATAAGLSERERQRSAAWGRAQAVAIAVGPT